MLAILEIEKEDLKALKELGYKAYGYKHQPFKTPFVILRKEKSEEKSSDKKNNMFDMHKDIFLGNNSSDEYEGDLDFLDRPSF